MSDYEIDWGLQNVANILLNFKTNEAMQKAKLIVSLQVMIIKIWP